MSSDSRISRLSIDDVRARMSNTIARCYFTHHRDEDADGFLTIYFSGTVETGPFGFWVDGSGRVIADSTIGSGSLPSASIVEPCVRAAKLCLNESPAKKLKIKNEFTGREIIVDPSKPLTPKKIAGWRSKLHCYDCMSGDDLGGRGKQENQDGYNKLLMRAQRMLIRGHSVENS